MIDLRSDTVTQPGEAMREAARDAEVGDDVYGEDPSVNELESRAAALFGTESALFVPSGTMGNQIAVRTHTDRGDEILCERDCHLFRWELSGVAQHAQVQPRTLDGGNRGRITPAQVRDNVVEPSGHQQGTGLVTLENTHNAKGGTALSVESITETAEAAHDLDLPVHLDGARLFNAAVAHERQVADFVEPVDSVMCCLSKGLGAPVGSLLAGSERFIERAHKIRKLMGGGMRQAGIVAAPGIVALSNRDHLAEDHRRAKRLASGLERCDGLSVTEPETNIVLVQTDRPAESFLRRCEAEGILGVPFEDHVVRFCTHLNVTDDDVDRAIEAIQNA